MNRLASSIDGGSWKQVEAGDDFSCALSTKGQVYCWGWYCKSGGGGEKGEGEGWEAQSPESRKGSLPSSPLWEGGCPSCECYILGCWKGAGWQAVASKLLISHLPCMAAMQLKWLDPSAPRFIRGFGAVGAAPTSSRAV